MPATAALAAATLAPGMAVDEPRHWFLPETPDVLGLLRRSSR